MDKILIDGGAPLRGPVHVSGAKNAALPVLAAALLAEGDHVVRNVPDLADVRTMGRLLGHAGCTFERVAGAPSAVAIRTPRAVKPEAPYDLVRTMRASVLVLGPLLSRWGQARVSLPGGCAIGARPIDLHLKALTALGAEITLEHGYVEGRVPGGRLRGATFTFDKETVTGTENVMMAAPLDEGGMVLEIRARGAAVTGVEGGLRVTGDGRP